MRPILRSLPSCEFWVVSFCSASLPCDCHLQSEMRRNEWIGWSGRICHGSVTTVLVRAVVMLLLLTSWCFAAMSSLLTNHDADWRWCKHRRGCRCCCHCRSWLLIHGSCNKLLRTYIIPQMQKIFVSLEEPDPLPTTHKAPSRSNYQDQVVTFIQHLINAFNKEETFPALIWITTVNESVIHPHNYWCTPILKSQWKNGCLEWFDIGYHRWFGSRFVGGKDRRWIAYWFR